jgi:glycerol uptake facilitator-like aquaporin
MNRFETELLTFLNARRSNSTSSEYDNMTDTVYGMSIQWLGLLFAAFASGAQFSTRPKKERDPVSQVYSCCSFECLRLVNYISNASCEVVQTMLLLGNVLANGMNGKFS